MHIRADSLLLFAVSLCSKWGFADGDLLTSDPYYEWLLQDLGVDQRRPLFMFQHEVLCDLVEKYLLPLLPVPVTVERVSTSHNPIRATSIDGQPWDSGTGEHHPALQNIYARVPWPAVLAACRAHRPTA
jgi:hypothetical protein